MLSNDLSLSILRFASAENYGAPALLTWATAPSQVGPSSLLIILVSTKSREETKLDGAAQNIKYHTFEAKFQISTLYFNFVFYRILVTSRIGVIMVNPTL